MDDLKYWLWLNSIDGVGPIAAKRLLEQFENPRVIWDLTKKQLQMVEGIGEQTANAIIASKNQEHLDKRVNMLKKHNISCLTINRKNYPKNLKEIYSPPIVLYEKGQIELQCDICIAIVGARNATSYGMKAAYDLAKQLSQRGITVVSGMARGIDTAAHKGALEGGGKTIAVLGCGLDYIYPPENRELMNKILKNGLILSEYPVGTIPDARNFPARNRIISGISCGTVVIEANIKSGSLITANFALEQNREVFAVPGPIYSKLSAGTNNLIKQGAKLVSSVEDILEELNIEVENYVENNEKEENIYNNLNSDEYRIISEISTMPIHLDNIIKYTGFTIDKINTIITMLELKGLIKQLPGKQFVRM